MINFSCTEMQLCYTNNTEMTAVRVDFIYLSCVNGNLSVLLSKFLTLVCISRTWRDFFFFSLVHCYTKLQDALLGFN